MNETHLVWTDATRRYFYLIPQSAELPAGDFQLWSPLHGQKSVEAIVLVPYEVTPEVARQHFQAEVSHLTGNIQETLTHLFNFAMQSNSGTSGEDLLKWLLHFFGGNPGQLTHEPREVFVHILHQVQALVEGKTEATAAMKSVLPIDWGEVQARLKQVNLEQDERLQQALADLQVLITGLQKSDDPAANERLRVVYQRYQEETQRQQAEHQATIYRAEIKRSVDEAVQKSMKPIDVKSWIEAARAKYRQEKLLDN